MAVSGRAGGSGRAVRRIREAPASTRPQTWRPRRVTACESAYLDRLIAGFAV